MTLAGRTFRSGVIVTGSSLGQRLINLGALVVLARLLVPEDFGAVALALVVVSTSTLFSTVGMGAAIVASPAEPRRAAYHAGLLNLALCTTLFVAAVGVADPLASLLGAPDLDSVFRWMSIVILLEALTVVPNALLTREMLFGRQSAAQLLATTVQFGLAIALAASGAGVWALVAGNIAGSATRWGCLSVLAPRVGWVRLQRWDRALARDLFRVGATTMATGLVRHVYTNADRVVIGRLFGATAVGFYTQSYTITNIPVQSVSQVTNAVLLPAYTRVRDDPERLARGYTSSFRLVAFLTVPLAVGLFLVAPQIVITLLGEQWRPSIVILQILAGVALFRPLSGTTFPLFLAIGRPALNLSTAIVQMVAMAPLVLVLHPLGVEGVAAAVAGTFIVGFVFTMWQLVHRTGVPISLRRMARGMAPILAASGLMASCVVGARFGLTQLGLDAETPLALLLTVASGVVAYGGLILVLDRTLITEVLALVRSRQPMATGKQP